MSIEVLGFNKKGDFVYKIDGNSHFWIIDEV